MQKIKTVFFGTHNFATIILQGLIDNPLFEVVLVITQPDRPVGRKKELTSPPVKILAEKNGIPVEQPASLKNFKFQGNTCTQAQISNFKLSVVAQYGLLIPKHIIEMPTYGTINVHTSLLPKYRGASPIQSALLAGEETTGVTIMQMDVGMDSGDIILQRKIEISPNETYLELDERMAHIGVELLNESLPHYISGELKPTKQDESQVTFCKKLSRDDGNIDWQKTTQKIYNQYRGLTPWPGVWTTWHDKRLKLLEIKPGIEKIAPGLVSIKDDILLIGTTDTSIKILKLQLEGKPPMNAKTFINGYKQINNQILK